MSRLDDIQLANGMPYKLADDRFRDRHLGMTCLIIANGPSLKDVPLEFLKSYLSFGCNRIYLMEDFTPSYFVQLGMDQVANGKSKDFFDICERVDASFVNRAIVAQGDFDGINNVYPILSRPIDEPDAPSGIGPQFSSHPLYAIGIGGSVVFQSLQLAYWMGFKIGLIVGLDHQYPESLEEPWHFYENNPKTTDYNGPAGGRDSWLARTDHAFEVSYLAWEADGRQLFNLTPETKSKTFPVADIQHWYSPKLDG